MNLLAQHKDGTHFAVEIGLSPVGDACKNRVLVVICDIRERQKNEDRLKESELRYRSLVELSPEAIIVHIDGTILYANQAVADLLGVNDPLALQGKSILDFVPGEHREEIAERMRRESPLGERRFGPTLRACRPDGTFVILEPMSSRTLYEGVIATQVLLRDVTDREQTQAELLASRQQLRDLTSYLQAARGR